MFLLVSVILVYIAFLWFFFKSKSVYLLFGQLLTIIFIGLIVEVGGQIYVFLHPSFKSLPFIPDPILGWRFIPNFKYTITGNHWYAREFSVEVETNSLGYRDLERIKDKKEKVVRIAILGNSMISAREVDFKNIASQLLEKN